MSRADLVEFTLTVLLACILTPPLVTSQLDDGNCEGPETCVYNHVFRNYNPMLRPIKNVSKPILIKSTFFIRGLLAINEKEETMSVMGWFDVEWNDELLRWNSDDFNGTTEINVRASHVWLPDITVTNAVDSIAEKKSRNQVDVKLHSNGDVLWSYGGVFITQCPLDLSNYPFDEQTCDMTLENWAYTNKDVDFVEPTDLNPAVNNSYYKSNALWILKQIHGEKTYLYPPFPVCLLQFTWKRKSLYYMYNIVLPSSLILTVSMGVFWLPADCGEKVSLGITVLLAFLVFQIIIMDNTPAGSDYVPALSKLVMVVMVMSTISLLTSMVVTSCSFRFGKSRLPRCLRKIVFALSRFVLSADEVHSNKRGEPNETNQYVAVDDVTKPDGVTNNDKCSGMCANGNQSFYLLKEVKT